MDEKNEQRVRNAVLNSIYLLGEKIPIRVSGRHIHLCPHDFKRLFGTEYIKDFEGPYIHKYEAAIMTPSGVIANVPVIGPAKERTQVEILFGDVRKLKIPACVRLSGDLEMTPGLILLNQLNTAAIQEGVIIAKRHLHIGAEKAQKLHLQDGQVVSVVVDGNRKTTFENVAVRIKMGVRFELHLDQDEASACNLGPECYCYLIP